MWPLVNRDDEVFSYIRFHGAPQLYRSLYTDEQLGNFATLILKEVQQKKNVYVYFNNEASGHAAENAKKLMTIQDL